MRTTIINSNVLVVVDGKALKGTITEVISQRAARIDLAKGGSIQASYSPTREEGTFHYPDEADTAKKAAPATP